MIWRIEFDAAALKSLKKLDRQNRKKIIDFIDLRLATAEDPRDIGKPLTGDKRGLWRYRVGDYRLICQIQDEVLSVLILAVGHRRDIYR